MSANMKIYYPSGLYQKEDVFTQNYDYLQQLRFSNRLQKYTKITIIMSDMKTKIDNPITYQN